MLLTNILRGYWVVSIKLFTWIPLISRNLLKTSLEKEKGEPLPLLNQVPSTVKLRIDQESLIRLETKHNCNLPEHSSINNNINFYLTKCYLHFLSWTIQGSSTSIYCYPDGFVVSQLISFVRRAGRLKLGLKTAQLYVRPSIIPHSHQLTYFRSGIIRHYIVAFYNLPYRIPDSLIHTKGFALREWQPSIPSPECSTLGGGAYIYVYIYRGGQKVHRQKIPIMTSYLLLMKTTLMNELCGPQKRVWFT